MSSTVQKTSKTSNCPSDREEGEIVSDNEEISISSDEEASLRQRIKELEAKNEELKKISHLPYVNYFPNVNGDRPSCGYGNQKLIHNRAHFGSNVKQYVPEDPSWLSDGLNERKKTKRRKERAAANMVIYNDQKNIRLNPVNHWCQKHLRTNKKRQMRRRTRIKSRFKKNGQKELPPSQDVLFSDITVEDLTDDSFHDSSDIYKETLNKRENSRTLKDRLLQDKYANNSKNEENENIEEFENTTKKVTQPKSRCEENRENEENSEPEEQELRLIALRSAVINKHKARKKREAESAYSPTDFEELFGNNLDSCHVTDVNDEFDGFQSTMEISPDNSPNLLLTPIEIDDDNSSDCIYNVDTKPVDMDIANSDIENEIESMGNENKWSSTNRNSGISLNTGPANFNGHIGPPMDVGIFNIQSSQIIPDCVAYNTVISMPPAFNYCVLSQESAQNVSLDFIPFNETPLVNMENLQDSDVNKANKASSMHPTNGNDKYDSDEEEAEALRALLLSKIRSKNKIPKNTEQKQVDAISPPQETKDPNDQQSISTNIIGQRRDTQTSILKDAVKRLKMLNDQSCKENVKKTDRSSFPAEIVIKDMPQIEDNCYPTQDLMNSIKENENCDRKNNGDLEDDIMLPSSPSESHDFPKHLELGSRTENETSKQCQIKETEISKQFPNTDDKEPHAPFLPQEIGNQEIKDSTNVPKKVKKLEKNVTTAIQCPKKNISMIPSTNVAVRPVARVKKIVKPNKVINKNVQIKEKELSSIGYIKKPTLTMKSTPPSSSAISDKRLVTNAKLTPMPVNKLIISLRASDTDTSDDENIMCAESLSSTKKNNYFENASPLSLPMTSPSASPARPSSPIVSKKTKAASLDIKMFEQKIDSFLKDMRSQVNTDPLKAPIVRNKSEEFETPTAVCHLPAHAQHEYRQLVHRMKMLEKEKQRKDANATSSSRKTDLTAGSNNRHIISSNKNLGNNTNWKSSNNNVQNKNVTPNQKPEMVHRERRESMKDKKSSNCTSENEPNLDKCLHGSSSNFEDNVSELKTETSLQNLEVLFGKVSSNLLTYLNKSLKIVDEAKTVKEDKLRCEKILDELCKKVEEIKKKIHLQDKKISKFIPSLRTSNEVITNLKKKRNQLFQKTASLGRQVKGEQYRLADDRKQEITQKMQLLAQKIRNVNTLKCSDIEDRQQANRNEEENTTSAMVFKSTTTTNESSNDISQNINANTPVVSDSHNEAIPNVTTSTEASQIPIENIESSSIIPGKEEKSLEANIVEPTMTNIDKRKLSNKLGQRKKFKRAVVKEYISPLDHIRRCDSELDPNGVLCPFQLWGICDDVNCSYLHLSDDSHIGKEA